MNFQELMQRMVELDQPVSEEKKADKDYDGDGEVESGKDEYMGSRMKAAEKDKSVDEDIVDECGMPGMENMPSSMMGVPKQQDTVSMNVSMNGAGAGGIRDLMAILRNIEDGADGPDSMRSDGSGPMGSDDMDVIVKKMAPSMDMIDDDLANQPDEIYGDIDAVTGTGNDIHSKGAEAPKVNGGGNPMKVAQGETFKLPSGNLKIKLESLYQEIKSR
jgi:hypothetical protein